MRESELQQAIRLAIQPERAVLWRNNCGVASHVTRDGRVLQVRYGLAPGSADLVGLRRSDGRFVALEIKTETGRLSPEQRQWLALVERCGGVARVVRSVEDALEALR